MTRWMLLPLCLLSLPALAYDRAQLPVEVGVAQSDVVVVARVVEVQGVWRPLLEVKVEVERSLLGELKGPLSVEVEHPAEVGDRLLLHLSKVDGAYKTVLDGTEPWTQAAEDLRKTQLAARPAWPDAVGGWSAVLVLVADKGQLDGWAVYRNTADKAQAFAYTEWPTEAHTHWDLEVVCGDTPVAARPHPHVTAEEVADFFSKHGNSFSEEVAPGGFFALPLQRITTAEPGWGYKQRLGFRYWPVEDPTKCKFTATDVNFAGRAPLTLGSSAAAPPPR